MTPPKIEVYYTTAPEPDDYMSVMTTEKEMESWGLQYIAEQCAQDYYINSNWEREHQIPFWLWTYSEDTDFVLLGEFEVYVDWEPVFTAFNKPETKAEVPIEKQVTAAYVESLTPYMTKPK